MKSESGLRASLAERILSTICLVFDLREPPSAFSVKKDGTTGCGRLDPHLGFPSRSSLRGCERMVCRRVGKLTMSRTGGDGDGEGEDDGGERKGVNFTGLGTKDEAVALRGFIIDGDSDARLYFLGFGVIGRGSESAESSESVRSIMSAERARSMMEVSDKHESHSGETSLSRSSPSSGETSEYNDSSSGMRSKMSPSKASTSSSHWSRYSSKAGSTSYKGVSSVTQPMLIDSSRRSSIENPTSASYDCNTPSTALTPARSPLNSSRMVPVVESNLRYLAMRDLRARFAPEMRSRGVRLEDIREGVPWDAGYDHDTDFHQEPGSCSSLCSWLDLLASDIRQSGSAVGRGRWL